MNITIKYPKSTIKRILGDHVGIRASRIENRLYAEVYLLDNGKTIARADARDNDKVWRNLMRQVKAIAATSFIATLSA